MNRKKPLVVTWYDEKKVSTFEISVIRIYQKQMNKQIINFMLLTVGGCVLLKISSTLFTLLYKAKIISDKFSIVILPGLIIASFGLSIMIMDRFYLIQFKTPIIRSLCLIGVISIVYSMYLLFFTPLVFLDRISTFSLLLLIGVVVSIVHSALKKKSERNS